MMDFLEPASIPSAAPSPRIVGGVLKWYAGDTFELQVDLELKDENGEAVVIESGQSVEFVFRDRTGKTVYAVGFEDIADNRVVVRFDASVSALFPKGRYTYDVVYRGPVRRTLAHGAPVMVE